MHNVQVVRNDEPVAIDWSWNTLGFVQKAVERETGDPLTSKHTLNHNYALQSNDEDEVLLTLEKGDTIKQWRS